MAKKISLDPHEITRSIEVRVTSIVAEDGRSVEWETDDDEDSPTVVIDLSDQEWQRLDLVVEATVPENEGKKLIPRGRELNGEADMLLLLRCRRTLLRQAIPMGFEGRGRWRTHFSIYRDMVFGSVELKPTLARTTTTDAAGANHAADQADLIGEASISLAFERSDSRGGSSFNILWEDFENSENSWRREHQHDICMLETGSHEPVLYLNSRYDRLRAALHSRLDKGPDAVIRNLFNLGVATATWMQMFVTAAVAIEIDEEEVTVPHDWRSSVLSVFLPDMFPEMEERARLKEANDMLRSADRVGSLLTMVSSVAQRQVRANRLVGKAISAGRYASA